MCLLSFSIILWSVIPYPLKFWFLYRLFQLSLWYKPSFFVFAVSTLFVETVRFLVLFSLRLPDSSLLAVMSWILLQKDLLSHVLYNFLVLRGIYVWICSSVYHKSSMLLFNIFFFFLMFHFLSLCISFSRLIPLCATNSLPWVLSLLSCLMHPLIVSLSSSSFLFFCRVF